MTGELDLPFEETPGGPVEAPQAFVAAGGLVVRSAVVPTSLGPLPALLFDFFTAEGKLTPIALVGDDDTIAKAVPLVEAAAASAIKAAAQAAAGGSPPP